jgi:hypothetical protein
MNGPVKDASNVAFRMPAMMAFERRPSIFMMHPTRHYCQELVVRISSIMLLRCETIWQSKTPRPFNKKLANFTRALPPLLAVMLKARRCLRQRCRMVLYLLRISASSLPSHLLSACQASQRFTLPVWHSLSRILPLPCPRRGTAPFLMRAIHHPVPLTWPA